MNTANPNLHSVTDDSDDTSAASTAVETRERASREAARIGEMARDWWQRHSQSALDLAGTVKQEVAVAGDRSRRYVRDEPLRSVAMAAAAGAAITALLMLLGRSRRH